MNIVSQEVCKLCFVNLKVATDKEYNIMVICIALAVTILLSKVVGAVLPMLAEKLGFDPALMASPIITTVVDALSLLVYFNIARVMLGL